MSGQYINLLIEPCEDDELLECCGIIVVSEGVTGPQGPPGEPGEPGEPGPPGPAGGTYEHAQAGALATWTIVHSLGFNPNVEVLETGGEHIIGYGLIYDSINQLRLLFSAAVSGTAYLS